MSGGSCDYSRLRCQPQEGCLEPRRPAVDPAVLASVEPSSSLLVELRGPVASFFATLTANDDGAAMETISARKRGNC